MRACISAISIQAVVQRATAASCRGSLSDRLASYLTGQDARLLQQVVSDSSRVIHIATSPNFRTCLAYAPARVRISVISSSVFLLKALTIGAPSTEMPAVLHTLDQCTATFKRFPADDMDFALRYAQLIEKYTSHLRASLVPASAGPAGEGLVQDSSGTSDWPDLAASLSVPPHGMTVDDNMGLDLNGAYSLFPFDLSMAPFGDSADQLSRGFEVNSLDFLWNITEMSS